ncbi:hypothetical protein, partial [Bacillus pumilus]|uniref:hypothetical protein n=1 Tax=Bacillus pumilus TaxID=1408 RepID=UPI001C92D6C3
MDGDFLRLKEVEEVLLVLKIGRSWIRKGIGVGLIVGLEWFLDCEMEWVREGGFVRNELVGCLG